MEGQKLLYTKPKAGEEIVISGMSGTFPESHDVYHFRDNLLNKVDLMTVDNRRWIPIHPETPRRFGKLFDIQSFDAGFFGVGQKQGDHTDPILRMCLEKAIEAIMDAGYHPSELAETKTGVFVSFCGTETESIFYKKDRGEGDVIIGTERSMISKQISYFLRLKSLAFILDSACSSGLSTFYEAYRALRQGKCDRAIIVSGQLLLLEGITLQFVRLGALSKDGYCRAFDEGANGYARAEAVTGILLEKSKHARRKYAEIVHCKVNNDGFKEHGISFPSVAGQAVLMKEFYDEINLDPNTIKFVEAHGTGTLAGDPVEASSIREVFCRNRKNNPLYIGSVKSNLGHSEASSASCSIIKVLLAMESGYFPPNMHFEKPIKELGHGEIVVVTEKEPLSDSLGLIAVNSFGFGGSNGHMLLHWNEKLKINNGQPDDDIPRLICVSGRAERSITEILDDFKNRNCDSEYAYLIQQAFKKTINSIYRGYGIYTKQDEVLRSLKKMDKYPKKIHLVFNNFDQKWSKLGNDLMRFPTFAKSVKQIDDILCEANLEKTTSQILKTISIQIGLANLLKDIKLIPHKITGVGSGELIAAYMDNYLTLKQTILALFNIITNINKGVEINWGCLENVLLTRKYTYERWVPINEGGLRASPSKYFANNIIRSTDDNEIEKSNLKDEVIVVVGSRLRDIGDDAVILVDENSQNPAIDFLSNLGSVYEYGNDMEIDKLYPNIELPVSRGTPMLSPWILWNHSRAYEIATSNLVKLNKSFCTETKKISLEQESWNFVYGHLIDGRQLFPATGYLYLVWQCFNKYIIYTPIEKSQIVFEDVKFLRATTVSKEDAVYLTITIQQSTTNFWIEEGGFVIVTGKIHRLGEENVFIDIPTRKCDEDSMCIETKDIYKELRVRGYYYSGKFKKIKKCTIDASHGIIEWDDNWIAFLDNIIQLVVLQEDSRYLYVPTTLQHLIIDAPKCLQEIAKCENMVPVQTYREMRVIRTEGIEIRGLMAQPIARRQLAEPVLEYSEFVPNDMLCELEDSLRIFMQIALENSSTATVKVVEIPPDDDVVVDDLLCPLIRNILRDLPAISQDLMVLTTQTIELTGISVDKAALGTESNYNIVVVSDVLRTQEMSQILQAIKTVNGFVISRENTEADQSKFIGSPFNVFCVHRNDREALFLLRPIAELSTKIVYLDLSNGTNNYEWMERLQRYIKQDNKVILYAQNDETSGLLGLSNCLLREQSSKKISCFLMMDQAPPFDPDLDFYKEQMAKSMAVNIWERGAWGTYRHLLLPKNQMIETEHCFIKSENLGDLSSVTWMEGNINKNAALPMENTTLVDVYYAALNFRDLMTATGKVHPIQFTKDRLQEDNAQGFEFCGRDCNGRRVMGLCAFRGTASIVECNNEVLFPIPDDWTMEEAATVTTVYITVIQCLVVGNTLTPGQSILIHSGTGGIGQAAINICLHFGLTIFVTVGTQEKREFIREHYPQIKEEHIGNSRDTSFESMVHLYTNGRGVDYVLNSLSEEKLLASIRCLAEGGKFLEIGKYDLVTDRALALNLLEKDAEYIGVGLDKLMSSYHQFTFAAEFLKLLKCGAIKPLNRTIFKMDEVEAAYRFMGTGKHMGKILIKIRDEDDTEIYSVPRTLFKAKPRFYCNPDHSYLICGGLGGFGLEIADLLIIRGAKKLILTSKSGVSNGYQQYRLRVWDGYGVDVLTTTCCASTEKGCTELLEMANKMGPVGGIFNLGVVLKDALFENQTVESFETSMIPKAHATKFLDSISRRLCPDLKYFVVFSSLSCGRGNVGQANYGMANSVMERICEKRQAEGYPALAIQWGAIGDVGLVAQMLENQIELVIGGTLQQRIWNCLKVFDQFLMQSRPIVASMVVAEKSSWRGVNAFEDVLDILGIKDLKTVSMYVTLPELGMDSMMAVEIKQTLERDYEIFLTPQELRTLTLAKLKELSTGGAGAKTETAKSEHIDLLVRFLGDEASSNVPVIKMKTSAKDGEDYPHVFLLPGLEGTPRLLIGLCEKLNAHVTSFQFCNGQRMKTISDLTQFIFATVQSTSGNLTLLAHSYGCVVATELLSILERNGRSARVIYMDGSVEALQELVRITLPTEDENLFQTAIIFSIISQAMPKEIFSKHEITLFKLPTFEEKLNYLMTHVPETSYSTEYLKDGARSAYERINMLINYNFEGPKLKSKLTFFRATPVLYANAAPDYGLANQFENAIDIVDIAAGHIEMLEVQDLADEINNILKNL